MFSEKLIIIHSMHPLMPTVSCNTRPTKGRPPAGRADEGSSAAQEGRNAKVRNNSRSKAGAGATGKATAGKSTARQARCNKRKAAEREEELHEEHDTSDEEPVRDAQEESEGDEDEGGSKFKPVQPASERCGILLGASDEHISCPHATNKAHKHDMHFMSWVGATGAIPCQHRSTANPATVCLLCHTRLAASA
jgi:hypothetical protein